MPHQFDAYGHRLEDIGDEALEARVNELAAKLANLARAKGRMTDSARAVRTELYACCTRYFRVVGQGIRRGGDPFDGLLLDLMMKVTDYEGDRKGLYDPEKGPFTNYMRYLYPRRTNDEGDKEDRQSPVMSPEDPEAEPLFSHSVGFFDECVAEELLIELLVLAMNVKDLVAREKGVDHSLTNTGHHMALTEAVTFLVKSEDMENSSYLKAHERDTFEAMDVEFLNYFMTGMCRTLLDVCKTVILLKYASRTRWPLLSNSAYLDFLSDQHKRSISSSRVSQFRDEFRGLVEKLPTFKAYYGPDAES